jgi:DNA-binding XRE family transcriptional regulator
LTSSYKCGILFAERRLKTVSISNKILQLRTEFDMTQAQLAKIAQVSEKSISAWEKGTRSPKIGPLIKICEHFGLDIHAFIEDSQISPDNRTDDARIIEKNPRVVSPKELKFALWGGTDISDEDLEDVRRYAAFIAERKKKN